MGIDPNVQIPIWNIFDGVFQFLKILVDQVWFYCGAPEIEFLIRMVIQRKGCAS